MNSDKKKIIIAEDHNILRAGLKALLTSNPQFDVIGEADNGRDAIRRVIELKPDLVIMDLNMPGMNGMDAIREIRERDAEIKTLVLTVHNEEEYVLASLKAGANGYVLKDATQNELMTAAERVLNGKTYLSAEITEKVVNSYLQTNNVNNEPLTRWDTVTQRERQILKLIAEGHTNKSMADYLCISVKTVEKHRANLMKKLDLHNVSALTTYALEKGLINR
ncbi:MAG: response regulator transcription factor [Candidatus Thiodiazotropha lotti]|uniref:DNA-binding response regulator n=2 Tax=Candidatus Thiodiazotropha TaxID=1913444 RepID=A0A1E2USI5_9GAMM|nr:response regulator transcription factor [Candidatus Thiodiazotropha endoloripes]MCG7870817.1 response regulator transcription factor [Candidatus Thiodiazotropha lotti]MCG7898072.1 response regulator transcription factor [Candidatus Thiodiazotropha weberae]MCG7901578.1 response regulator transcription factor [Candidatus Thiodiazotropha weberae]MCG7913812.1 response regulator transcription factor [Candidatus Thiodiazotropha weberae]MCG7922901.1 response regulator transcription factor [Candida